MKSDATQFEQQLIAGPKRVFRREALHEQVVDRLRQMVVKGEIGLGERLNEVAIAEALNVSRTPLREAIKLLASEGLLELLPGRGARVRRYRPEEIRDLFEVIGALERHAAETAVTRMKPDVRAQLQALFDRMKSAHGARNRRLYFQANQKIHAIVVAEAGSAELAAIHAGLTKKTRHDRLYTLLSEVRWDASMREHALFNEAVQSGDAQLAGRLMLDHIRKTGIALAQIMQQTPEPWANKHISGSEPSK